MSFTFSSVLQVSASCDYRDLLSSAIRLLSVDFKPESEIRKGKIRYILSSAVRLSRVTWLTAELPNRADFDGAIREPSGLRVEF